MQAGSLFLILNGFRIEWASSGPKTRSTPGSRILWLVASTLLFSLRISLKSILAWLVTWWLLIVSLTIPGSVESTRSCRFRRVRGGCFDSGFDRGTGLRLECRLAHN